jgi:regulatory protein
VKIDKAIVILKEICSRREKCCSDIRKKLDAWDIPPDNHNTVIEALIKDKFIDERRYSVFFTNDKFKFNKWGKIKIRYALIEKGINENNIDQAFENINSTDYHNTLKELLGKKLSGIKDPEKFKKKAKLIRFGQSRGFESNLLYSIIDQLLK